MLDILIRKNHSIDIYAAMEKELCQFFVIMYYVDMKTFLTFWVSSYWKLCVKFGNRFRYVYHVDIVFILDTGFITFNKFLLKPNYVDIVIHFQCFMSIFVTCEECSIAFGR